MKNSSISLSLFEEKIQLEGLPSPLEVTAYRMDGSSENKPPMAKYAGLDSPSCCDYLYLKKNTRGKAILIEDTRMGKKLQRIRLKLEDLENEQKTNKIFRAKEILRQENCLKVYGTLLILCRLSKNRSHKTLAEELAKHKFYDFWLIINDEDDVKAIDNEEIKGIIDFLKKKLRESLAGSLRGAIKNVQILFADELTDKLKQAECA